MRYTVVETEVEPVALVSCRARIRWNEIGTTIRPLLDKVYAHLAGAKGGHNVCLYHDPGPDGFELECGVQAPEGWTFPPSAEVARTATPGGRVVTTTHWGPYHELGQASDALIAWCRENGRAGGLVWEVYGDWEEDPAKLRTDVYRLLHGSRTTHR
jgi:effector-binding domain-containing protein